MASAFHKSGKDADEWTSCIWAARRTLYV